MSDSEDAMKRRLTYLIRRLIYKTDKALEYFEQYHDDFEVSCTIQGEEYFLTLPTSDLKKALRKDMKYYKKELIKWEAQED